MNQVMLNTNVGVPILGICWCPEKPALLLACADNAIKLWDLPSNQVMQVGSHTQPVKDVYAFFQNNTPVIVSGGWDSRVKFWTWSSPNQLNQIGEAYLGKPVHYMSGEFPLLVIAHSEMFIHYWDLRQIFNGNFNPLGVMMSPLKYATTSIACFSDAKGFVVGSIEGRCGVKNIDLDKNVINLPDDFCFKSHRVDDTKSTIISSIVHAVNGISFNKQYNTFATMGQDGCYFFWNKDNKSKLKSTKNAPYPVTCGDYLDSARMFAFALGYDWGKGAEEAKKGYPVYLFVRKVKDDEAFKKPTGTGIK
jgi:mRNA export factor